MTEDVEDPRAMRDWVVERTWLTRARTATDALLATAGGRADPASIRTYEGPPRPWEAEATPGFRIEAFELDGSPHDFDQHAELSGFAGDALYELHRLVEGHDGLRVKVSVEWRGTY